MRLSVVIPVLDEQGSIGDCLKALSTLGDDVERIVVDGGSSDDTCRVARSAGAERIVTAARGRGQQLNAGARAARGSALLFLHADVRLPADARCHIDRVLDDERYSGGAFRLRHQASAAIGPLARRLLWISDLRSRRTGLPYGDQALFTTRERFEQIGGFPDQTLMEDLEFARRLRATGPIRIVAAEVRASARRFEQRPLHSFCCWMLFPTLYRLGVSPERLASWYGRPRDDKAGGSGDSGHS